MKQIPFLSFVLTTRDRPALLSKCLYYLAQQSFENFEVIVSDNSVIGTSKSVVEPYLIDSRFSYVRPSNPMSMPDHWDFAIQHATGTYITLINEKFMFHPNAATTLKSMAKSFNDPDILSWQYEHFHMSDSNGLLGTFHPLFRPCTPSEYSVGGELKRRLDFIEPLFGRHTQEKISFGKIYSGAVKKDVIDRVKKVLGRVFPPTSPDFTSLVCFLNFSKCCLDVGRSLMLVVSGDNISTGESTRLSLQATKRSLSETYSNSKQYLNSLIIPGLGVGHTMFIASDYLTIQKQLPRGNLGNYEVNIAAVIGWTKIEMDSIADWGDKPAFYYYDLVEHYCSRFTPDEKLLFDSIKEAKALSQRPSPREIYHSGLEKVTMFEPDILPERLAYYHGEKKLALPRKPVCSQDQKLDDAVSFFVRYIDHSIELLNL